jgi:tetratricopeptide (TPR) repeat protein
MTRHIAMLLILAVSLLTACVSTGAVQRTAPPDLSLIPMYGYPEIEKPELLKKVDDDFIKSVVGPNESREEVSKQFAGEGWQYYREGDLSNAMRRFNQAWLLDPNNYLPYWGFGILLFAQRKSSEAIPHLEKALSLLDNEGAKPPLLSDTARAYSSQATRTGDKAKADVLFRKANSMLSEATTLDPKFGKAYRDWAISLFLEGNYKKAWEMVKISRGLPGQELSPTFVKELSSKMPEPK